MKRRIYKWFGFFLAVLMMVGTLPMAALAAPEGVVTDDTTFPCDVFFVLHPNCF